MGTVDFDAPDLATRIEALDDDARHDLPFGIVKLDGAGRVTFYSRTEARQSGRKSRPTVGLDFFADVAPCMSAPDMRGRIDAARQRGAVDVEIGWVGDFDDPDGEIRIRALSAADGGLWLCLNRDEG